MTTCHGNEFGWNWDVNVGLIRNTTAITGCLCWRWLLTTCRDVVLVILLLYNGMNGNSQCTFSLCLTISHLWKMNLFVLLWHWIDRNTMSYKTLKYNKGWDNIGVLTDAKYLTKREIISWKVMVYSLTVASHQIEWHLPVGKWFSKLLTQFEKLHFRVPLY